MPETNPSQEFEEVLSSYVERGIFRNLKETSEGNAQVFRFAWLSEFHRFTLAYDLTDGVMAFTRMFPGIPEDVFAHLDGQVTKRSDPESKIADHKRIDPAMGTVSLLREGDDASLRMSLEPGVDDARALRAMVKLANDLIFDLQLRFPAYTYVHFAKSDD